jgi:hypothetical protein
MDRSDIEPRAIATGIHRPRSLDCRRVARRVLTASGAMERNDQGDAGASRKTFEGGDGRLWAAVRHVQEAESRTQLFTAIEWALTELADVSEFALVERGSRGRVAVWWSGSVNVDLAVRATRNQPPGREPLSIHPIGSEPGFMELVILELRGAQSFDERRVVVVDWLCAAAEYVLTRLRERDTPTIRPPRSTR